jgi:hypothetical protein
MHLIVIAATMWLSGFAFTMPDHDTQRCGDPRVASLPPGSISCRALIVAYGIGAARIDTLKTKYGARVVVPGRWVQSDGLASAGFEITPIDSSGNAACRENVTTFRLRPTLMMQPGTIVRTN